MTNQGRWEKWERTRARGKWHFVLVLGILCFGGMMFVARVLMNAAGLMPLRPLASFFDYCRVLGVSAIEGFLWGYLMWYITEKMYALAVRKNQPGD